MTNLQKLKVSNLNGDIMHLLDLNALKNIKSIELTFNEIIYNIRPRLFGRLTDKYHEV